MKSLSTPLPGFECDSDDSEINSVISVRYQLSNYSPGKVTSLACVAVQYPRRRPNNLRVTLSHTLSLLNLEPVRLLCEIAGAKE